MAGVMYYPYMASIAGKKRGTATYYYLVESARVNGQPRIISQEYLGTAEELAAAMRGGGLGLPDKTRHKEFGAAAAAWGMLEDLGVTAIIDEVAGPRPAGQPLSTGTYLALAALNRLVAPCSKAAFADWWKTTAADRFTKVPAAALDHRRFWDAMHAVTVEQLEEISQKIAVTIVQSAGVDVSSVALDMTNFATFIDTANGRAPVAQRGKAKQKRSDLRLVGLGLAVTRDGGIPLTWHAYPGNKPDVTQFPDMITQLRGQYQAVCAAAGVPAAAADMTVVSGAGQNSEANFTHLAAAGHRRRRVWCRRRSARRTAPYRPGCAWMPAGRSGPGSPMPGLTRSSAARCPAGARSSPRSSARRRRPP